MTLDWHTILGTASGIILAVILIPYIRSVLYGPTRPNPVSWGGWMVLAGIATAAQFSAGASWTLLVPVMTTISTAVIFLLSLRAGRAGFMKVDGAAAILGAAAIGSWTFTEEPLWALIFVVAADLFVSVPTVVKTYGKPLSEPALLWFLYFFGVLLAIAASTKFDVYNLLYPVYAVLVSGAIWLLALRGRLKRI
ncbi:MAG: hypothetical protein HYT22_03985 [Candidatus Niyogibacteria bacterium]|nr:hypothetical protein [Candidatus Niyogibacteria bacterium]